MAALPDPTQRKPRSRRAKWALAAVSTVVALGVLELAARAFLPDPRAARATAPGGLGVETGEPLCVATAEPYLFRLNPQHPDVGPQGLRDDAVEIPKPPGTFRVLVLGDSVAYGEEVARGETFPDRMEEALRGRGRPVEVVNAGVRSYSPFNELHWYLEEGREFGADVVVVAFCMNDVADPQLHWSAGPDRRLPFDAIPNPEYHARHIVPLVHARFRRAVEEAAAAHADGAWRDVRLYEFARRGIAKLFGPADPVLADLLSERPRCITGEDTLGIEVLEDATTPEWRWLARTYDRLHQAVAADGARLVVAVFPVAWQLHPAREPLVQQRFEEYCRARKLPLVDLLPAFRRHGAQDLYILQRPNYYDVWHLTVRGHEVAAEEIVRALGAEGLLPE